MALPGTLLAWARPNACGRDREWRWRGGPFRRPRALTRRSSSCRAGSERAHGRPHPHGAYPGWHQAIELGAEFVHGEQSETFNLARTAGLTLEAIEPRHFSLEQGSVRPASELGELEAVFAAAASLPAERSALDFLESSRLSMEIARWFRQFVEGFHAAPLDRLSAVSLAEQGVAQDHQYRIIEGYGALIEYLERDATAHGAILRPACRALVLAHRQGHVEARCARETWQARAAIVALPLGVLRARPELGGVAFDPEPQGFRDTFARLEMGQALRLVFRFREPLAIHEQLPEGAFFDVLDAPVPTFWLGARREQPQLTAWCGGPRAVAFAGIGEATDAALASLETGLGVPRARLASAIAGIHGHAVGLDPHIGGAYPYRLPVAGRVPDPGLALEPLWFAGDFLEPEALGTVGAAIRSGCAAALSATAQL